MCFGPGSRGSSFERKFPTEEIVGAKNFNSVHKLSKLPKMGYFHFTSLNVVFLAENFLTRSKFSERGGLMLPPGHDVTGF